MRSERPKRAQQGGFTLVELIISIFLGALIIAPITMWIFVAIANSQQVNLRNQELTGGALLTNYLKADMDMASASAVASSNATFGSGAANTFGPCPNSSTLGTRSWSTGARLLMQVRTKRLVAGATQPVRVDYTMTADKPGTPNESYSIWRRSCRADTTGVAQPLEDEARVATGLLPKTATTKIKPAALTEFTGYAGSTATLPHFRCVKTVMSGTTLKNCNQIAVTIIGGAGDVVRIQASRGVANTYPDDNGELDARDVPDVKIYRDPNQRWEDPSTGAAVPDTVDARSITRWEGGSCPPTGEPSAAQRAAGCHIVRRRFFTPLIYTRGMPKGSAVSTLNYSVYFDDPAITPLNGTTANVDTQTEDGDGTRLCLLSVSCGTTYGPAYGYPSGVTAADKYLRAPDASILRVPIPAGTDDVVREVTALVTAEAAAGSPAAAAGKTNADSVILHARNRPPTIKIGSVKACVTGDTGDDGVAGTADDCLNPKGPVPAVVTVTATICDPDGHFTSGSYWSWGDGSDDSLANLSVETTEKYDPTPLSSDASDPAEARPCTDDDGFASGGYEVTNNHVYLAGAQLPAGTYYYPSLHIVDNDGATYDLPSAQRPQVWVWGNDAPVAVAEASTTVGGARQTTLSVNMNDSLYFWGEDSYDPDCAAAVPALPPTCGLSFEWSFTDDGSFKPTTLNTYKTFTKPETVIATLTVTDSGGATVKATVTIYVGNRPPVAVATVRRKSDNGTASGTAPLATAFNYSAGSYDPDCGGGGPCITAVEWDYEGDGIVDSTLGDHDWEYTFPGTYTPKIRVKDNSGVVATEWSAWTPVNTGRPDNKVVVVNNPPTAFATASPSEGPRYRADCLPSPGPRCNTLRVSFSAVGSSDPDPGQTITYSWDFGDGQFGSGVNVTHDFLFDNPTAAKPIKIYLATLTVTDNYGSSSAPFVLDISVFADDDGDGVTVEDKDCNDARAEAYPGAPDLLDDDRSTSAPGFGADTNCDGYDGVEVNTVFVDTSKANTSPFNSAASCGTPAAPCRTVALALQVSGGSRNTIFLASTAALGPQVVNEKVTLRGGFAASFKDANASGNSSIAAALETGTLRAWGLMLNGASGSTIWDLSIAGADRSAKTDSSVSYGAVLFNSPGVVMKNVSIVGGKGGKGAAGANATSAPNTPAVDPGGVNLAGQNAREIGFWLPDVTCDDGRQLGGFVGGFGNGGDGGQPDARCTPQIFNIFTWSWVPPMGCLLNGGDCTDTAGLPGRSGPSASPSCGQGGSQGGAGYSGSGGNGSNGARGCDGTAGAGGTAVAGGTGAADGTGWWAPTGDGNDGALGTPGGRGGGGGGGGGSSSSLFGNDDRGAGGGAGGAGGAAAPTVGAGGKAGGAAISVYLYNSSVTFAGGTIEIGSGGSGGNGGKAGKGQPGSANTANVGYGVGGRGKCDADGPVYGPCASASGEGGAGGNGGRGGTGGNSGGGAGGAGGPAIGVYSKGSVVTSAPTFSGGGGGAGGAGGTEPGSSTTPNGQPGGAGGVHNVVTVP